MAAETNFKTLVERLSGAVPDNEDFEKFLIDGAYDVIRKVKQSQPGEMHRFLIASGNDTTGAAINIGGIKEIARATRDGIECRVGTPALAAKYNDVASIHYASPLDPVFYTTHGPAGPLLYIRPNTAGADIGVYYFIPDWTITNPTSGASTIGHSSDPDAFPEDYYEHVIMYAAIQILEVRLNDYLEDDEDLELVNATQVQLGNMKAKYEQMFGAV